MNQLRQTLVVTDARAINLQRIITKDGSTWVLHVRGPMTTNLADVLQCRQQCYNLDDHPYPGTTVKKDHEISSCEFSVAGHRILRPKVVTGFTVKPNELADAEGELELSFRMKFADGGKDLNALLDAFKSNPFDLSLLALQGGLFDQVDVADAGGKRVDMSPKKVDNQEEPPPLVKAAMEGDTTTVADGIGALPSAREMGGTHQAKGKRRNGIGVVTETAEAVQ